tara:strand:- start:75 stop:254 length:180 start_codon:yes stop_codon:yes gene_type:complete
MLFKNKVLKIFNNIYLLLVSQKKKQEIFNIFSTSFSTFLSKESFLSENLFLIYINKNFN